MPSGQCSETKRAAMVESPEREKSPLFALVALFVNTPCDDERMSQKGAFRRNGI
jgi:hypothetical protein